MVQLTLGTFHHTADSGQWTEAERWSCPHRISPSAWSPSVSPRPPDSGVSAAELCCLALSELLCPAPAPHFSSVLDAEVGGEDVGEYVGEYDEDADDDGDDDSEPADPRSWPPQPLPRQALLSSLSAELTCWAAWADVTSRPSPPRSAETAAAVSGLERKVWTNPPAPAGSARWRLRGSGISSPAGRCRHLR